MDSSSDLPNYAATFLAIASLAGLCTSLGCGARSQISTGTGAGGAGNELILDAGGTPASVPTTPSHILAIAAGHRHSCALLADHTVKCWGSNNVGQLGDDSTITTAVPVTVSGLTTAVAIAATHVYSCALLEEGSVVCWGYNINGQLGNGSTETRITPTLVSGISTATSLGIGAQHSCASLAGGAVRCWGYNQHGQLGDGTTTTRPTPVDVNGVSQARAVSTAGEQSCALLASGQVRCWGYNALGELGDGTTTDGPPVTVVGVKNADLVSVADSHACALLSDRTVRCWGRNDVGQLATDTIGNATISQPVAGLKQVWHLSAGFGSTAAVLVNGEVRFWGSAFDYVVTPQGLSGGTVLTDPTPVEGVHDAFAVAVGSDHACALLSDSRVLCWGRNSSGQLGDGTTTDSLTSPVQVLGLD